MQSVRIERRLAALEATDDRAPTLGVVFLGGDETEEEAAAARYPDRRPDRILAVRFV